MVSIPAPEVAEPEPKDSNTFSREFRVALYNYVCAYDDWCDAEGEYNESLPEDKQKEFVKNYQIEINKLLRSILDLEDAMLKDDHKTAEKILGGMKAVLAQADVRRRNGLCELGSPCSSGWRSAQLCARSSKALPRGGGLS